VARLRQRYIQKTGKTSFYEFFDAMVIYDSGKDIQNTGKASFFEILDTTLICDYIGLNILSTGC
jgi:hypothetical protein